MTESKYQIPNTKYKIHMFKDLDAWKQAHRLVLLIYKATSIFPKFELYSLADQMRRAAVSISSNIAEGFSRNTKNEKIRFYNISHGSLIALDLGYIDNNRFNEIENQIIFVQKVNLRVNKIVKNQVIHTAYLIHNTIYKYIFCSKEY